MEPLRAPATLDSLGTIARYVTAAAEEAGLDKKSRYRLRLAVDEVATNIVTHGYAEASREGSLDLRVEIDEKTLKIFMVDTGVPYDPRRQEAPSGLDLPLEERGIGGLGVYLAVRSVDEFVYERIGDRNCNIFIMKRPVDPMVE